MAYFLYICFLCSFSFKPKTTITKSRIKQHFKCSDHINLPILKEMHWMKSQKLFVLNTSFFCSSQNIEKLEYEVDQRAIVCDIREKDELFFCYRRR